MKLFVALPLNGPVPALFLNSMLTLVEQQPCELHVEIYSGSGLMLARNALSAAFLKSDCDRLLFIDGDIGFTPGDVARISSHDADFVGGFYAKKQEGRLEWVCAAHRETPAREDGLQACGYVGTGFLCLRRAVFERMESAFPEARFKQKFFDFWTMGVWRDAETPEGCYLTEDYYFCKRWLSLGGEIWADTRTVLQHVGDAVYPLETQRKAA